MPRFVDYYRVTDADRWITVHPNGKGLSKAGKDKKGAHVRLDSNGNVTAGMGGKFNGKPISSVKSKNKDPQNNPEATELPEGIKNASDMTKPQVKAALDKMAVGTEFVCGYNRFKKTGKRWEVNGHASNGTPREVWTNDVALMVKSEFPSSKKPEAVKETPNGFLNVEANRDRVLNKQKTTNKKKSDQTNTERSNPEQKKPFNAKTFKTKGAELTRNLGSHADGFWNSLGDASEDVQNMFYKHADKLSAVTSMNDHFMTNVFESLAVYDPVKKRVYTTSSKFNSDTKGNSATGLAKFSTMYHETGHHIDNLNSKSSTGYFSAEYKNGLYEKTIRSEVSELRNKTLDNMKRDFDLINQKGLNTLDDSGKLAIKNYLRKYDKAKLKRIESGSSVLRPLKPPTQTNADKYLKHEIFENIDLDYKTRQYDFLSDILDGATLGRIRGNAKHTEEYWTNEKDALPAEAFANMTSAATTNKKGYELLKKWLPKSIKVYEDMVKEISK